MDRLSEFRNRMRVVVAVCTVCCAAALTACSDDTNDAGRLPAGQYPITLTATVEGQTVTRATSDNTWEGTEEVALQVGGEVKKYTVAASGALTADNNDVQYWTAKTMTVQAWHSPQAYSATRPTDFTVKADQNASSGAGFQQSDLLYTSQSITYNANTNATNPPQLTFKHLPAKVVVNLKADTQNGVTEADVQNATVTLVNQALTSGAITYDDAALAATPVSVAQAAAGNVITPKVNASAASGYQQTVQALLVPQQMQGKQFVKITVGSSTYYYVPQNDDANLEHGKQYTYNITVKKEKLEVTVSSSVSWADDVTTGNAAEAVFHVKCPTPADKVTDFVVRDADAKMVTSTSETYEINTSTFTISYKLSADTPTNFRYLLDKGIATITDRSATGGVITLTVSIRGDLEFTTAERTTVGDYYYGNGTWSDTWYTDQACVGIVFYVGKHDTDDCNYSASGIGSDAIHGYVVALKDAGSSLKWGSGPNGEYSMKANTSIDKDDWKGYFNQTQIEYYAENTANWNINHFPAAKACADWGENNTYPNSNAYKAPASSSGWFLPSVGQLKSGLFENRAAIELALTKAGGNGFSNSYSWSSTENRYDSDRAWYVDFSNGYVSYNYKNYDYTVRAVLAF